MTSKKEKLEIFERLAMPDRYFEQAKAEFKEFYNQNFEKLQAAEKAFRNLVVLLLKEKEFPEPKVSSRLKELGECIRKFDGKYRSDFESMGENYIIADKITDIIGIRVVCLYETDIPKVAEILVAELEEIERTDKSKKLEEADNEFGYKGLHLDLRLNKKRKDLPEYGSFSSRQFEVQIRTIVQDAWSEVDHKLKYKKETPHDLRRRIYRLAALFELADQEFESIKIRSEELAAAAKSSEFDEASIVLDTFGFLRVVEQIFEGYRFYGDARDDLLEHIKQVDPKIKVKQFREEIEKNITKVRSYKDYLLTIGNSMSPFTQIRHCMYLSRKIKFQGIIFDGHRKNFDRWLEHGTVFPHEIRKK